MRNTVIKVENLGKQYRLGDIGTGTISHDLNRWWARVLGKEDPFLKLGELNDRTQKGNSDFVWALKDVSFDVNQGDVLGIIGKNGAGKSTLLKILSRTTSPTTGSYKVKGRIASLLEVGTGFHPELSGRENIFLNGAILGMTKSEIKSKFDEIVDFSGVERYIDTPVKRYSSGMYVRLAFAVAAHLEPEILIVDEVLAVGDQEFQDKCLGKMKDVSQQGRTVLFVSHNIGAVKNLCNKGLYLRNGTMADIGSVETVLQSYSMDMEKKYLSKDLTTREDRKGDGSILVKNIEIVNGFGQITDTLNAGDKFSLKINTAKIKNFNNDNFYAALIIRDGFGDRLTTISTDFSKTKISLKEENEIIFDIEKCPFSTGVYSVSVLLWSEANIIDDLENAFSFKVIENDYYGNGVLQGANIDRFFMDYKCYAK